MQKLKRKRIKKQKKIIIISIITFLFIMIGGYAAFQTNLNITAKGNIYDKGDLCFKTKDNGDGTVSITSYDETCGTDVVIPETIKGKTVTKIANGAGWNGINNENSKDLGAFANRRITRVTFPETITVIGNFSFYGNNLTEVILPDSVTTVGIESFKNNSINFIKYSSNLTTIKELAFSTNKLTEINIPASVKSLGNGAFTLNNVTTGNPYILGINSDGTTNNDLLNSYAGNGDYLPELPEVTTIGSYAFRNMSSLEITLPNSVTTIRYRAFPWVYNSTINISSQISTIDNNAFSFSTLTINIAKPENSITGSPWGADIATINWNT